MLKDSFPFHSIILWGWVALYTSGVHSGPEVDVGMYVGDRFFASPDKTCKAENHHPVNALSLNLSVFP